MDIRTKRGTTAAIALSALALGLVAPTVAAGSGVDWRPPINVRTADNVRLQDAEFQGRNVAITWQELGAGGTRVGFRRSVNAGNGFGPLDFISRARQSAVDLCGAGLHAAWAKRDGTGDWDIKYGEDSIDGTGFLVKNVASGPLLARFPDVACTNSRQFVTWFERASNGDRMKIAYSDPISGAFGAANDLGLDNEVFFGRSLAVAAVNDTAYVVFTRSDGDLRLKRFTIGAGPGFAVTEHAAPIIGGGMPDDSANGAVIAAAGNKVAVAWFRCDALHARVSNDRGQTWGPVREIVGHAACDGDFITFPSSIAIRGGRIVVTYTAAGIFGQPSVGLVSTTNDFASFSDDTIAGPHDQHLVGFVTVAGNTKLAAAFDTGDRIRYRRQQ